MNYILRPLFTLIIFSLLIQSCATETEPDPFLVANHHIGLLTDSTQIKDLKAIFKNDSLENYRNASRFSGITRSIYVFDKAGKHLLTLSPARATDSTATINTVKIEDERYKTAKGINIGSSFGELSKAYKVKKIDNLIKTIVISVEGLEASFTIDKSELPANMRFDRSLNIDPIQIPDEAKIKYFMLHW